MPTLSKRPRLDGGARGLRIQSGQVVCPRRGIVDIEQCWVCPDYRGLSTGRIESVLCGASPESLATEVWAVDHSRVPGA